MKERYYKCGIPKEVNDEAASKTYGLPIQEYKKLVDSIKVKNGVMQADLSVLFG